MLRPVIACACIALAGCSVFTRTKTGEWPEGHGYSRHLDEAYARHQAARRALVVLGKCHPRASSDFKYGFVQAYVDVALGGSGAVPPVPPERYWGSHRRDPEGYRESHEWFAGYAAGAQRALGSRWNAYNEVPHAGGVPKRGFAQRAAAPGW